jgi:hypothetical protein
MLRVNSASGTASRFVVAERLASTVHSAAERLFLRLVTAIRGAALSIASRLPAMTPDRWFLAVFALVLLAFLILLMVQPSSVGRGGR